MNRKQRRAAGVKEKVPTYTYTEEQLREKMKVHYNEEFERAKKECIAECTALMLILPMEVLMDHYWTKTYRKKIPEFVEYVLDYYAKWENGELDIEELKKDLWEYGGVRLEVNK